VSASVVGKRSQSAPVGPERIGALAAILGAPPPSGPSADALAAFAALVTTWNARLDLTAARTAEAVAEVLCADALVLAAAGLIPEGASVLDVGSGAGAPAIPLSILRPDLRLTLLEPARKRVAFLRTATGSLGLTERVRVVEGRLDPGAPAVPGAFDLAMARATFPPAEWLALGRALAPSCLLFTAVEPPPGAVARADYRLPSSGAPRVLSRYDRS